MNSELDYFEKVHNEKIHDESLGLDPLEEMKPSALFKVKSATIALPKVHPGFQFGCQECSTLLCWITCVQWRTPVNSCVQLLCLIYQSVIMVKLLQRSIGSECSK